MTWGIADAATYRPAFGLDAGLAEALGASGDVPLAAPDEDALTLLWESLRRLDASPDAAPGKLLLGLPAAPLEPRALAAHALAAGALSGDASVLSLAPESDAGELLRTAQALGGDAVAALVDLPPLRTATTAPGGDLALALRFGEPRVAAVAALAARNALAFDRWDMSAAPRAEIDQRFVEETLVAEDGAAVLEELLASSGRAAADLIGVVATCAIPLKPSRLAAALGVPSAWQPAAVADAAGAYSAQALSLALEQLADAGPGAAIALLELGWGGSGALLVAGPEIDRGAVSHAAPRRRYDYRGWQLASTPADQSGPWTSPAKLRREVRELLGPIGTVCSDCGEKSFPYQGVCEICGSFRVEPDVLERRGTVVTQTVDHLYGAPSAVVQMVVVDLDGGGRFLGQASRDAVRPLAIGDRAQLVLRRLHQANGLPHYFWKVDLDES